MACSFLRQRRGYLLGALFNLMQRSFDDAGIGVHHLVESLCLCGDGLQQACDFRVTPLEDRVDLCIGRVQSLRGRHD